MRRALAIGVLFLLVLSSCEQMFTWSPLAFLRRDPASLSEEQQIRYGRDALASGDRAAMAEAFDLLKDSTDPDVKLLAADLALGASGVDSVVAEVIAGIAGGGDLATIVDDALSSFADADVALILAAAGLIESASADAAPSAEQYALAAVGLIVAAAQDAGGAANLDPPPPGSDAETWVSQADGFLDAAVASLQASGNSTELLDELLLLIGGA